MTNVFVTAYSHIQDVLSVIWPDWTPVAAGHGGNGNGNGKGIEKRRSDNNQREVELPLQEGDMADEMAPLSSRL